jgi:hypothetical protein
MMAMSDGDSSGLPAGGIRCVGSCTRIAASAPTVFDGSLFDARRNPDAVTSVGAPYLLSTPWQVQQWACSTCWTLQGTVSAPPIGDDVHWQLPVVPHCDEAPFGHVHAAATPGVQVLGAGAAPFGAEQLSRSRVNEGIKASFMAGSFASRVWLASGICAATLATPGAEFPQDFVWRRYCVTLQGRSSECLSKSRACNLFPQRQKTAQ